MRRIQLQLWLAIGLGLGVYLGSLEKDLATALIFASVFGLVYGGGMSVMKPVPRAVSARSRQKGLLKRRPRSS